MTADREVRLEKVPGGLRLANGRGPGLVKEARFWPSTTSRQC